MAWVIITCLRYPDDVVDMLCSRSGFPDGNMLDDLGAPG